MPKKPTNQIFWNDNPLSTVILPFYFELSLTGRDSCSFPQPANLLLRTQYKSFCLHKENAVSPLVRLDSVNSHSPELRESNFDFSAGNRLKKFRIRKNIPKPLSKKFLTTYSDLGRFLPLFLFWGAIFMIFHTFTLRPFWPRKITYI